MNIVLAPDHLSQSIPPHAVGDGCLKMRQHQVLAAHMISEFLISASVPCPIGMQCEVFKHDSYIYCLTNGLQVH